MSLEQTVKQLEVLCEDLKMELGFQEQQLSDLNASLFEQQKQILELQQENRYLAGQVKKITDSVDDTVISDDPPPHY